MAIATSLYVSLPFAAAAAAAGIYFLDKNHYKPKEFGGGIRSSMENAIAKAKVEMSTTPMPKLAPQFDGLESFETLVGR